MTDNMKIWRAVEETDPAHTKAVTQRGGFTAIGANYQIMRATEQFGPIGIGWGYTAGEPIFHDAFVIVPVTMWHGLRENVFGPAYGCCQMIGNRPDADAPKKAGTDGLTKLLSQLGFNADVFLGKFDDNKYVAEVAEKFRKKAPQAVIDAAHGAETVEALIQVWTANKDWQKDPAFMAAKDKRKAELQEKDAA